MTRLLFICSLAGCGRSGFERREQFADTCATTVCAFGTRCENGVCVPFDENIVPVLDETFAQNGILRYDSGGTDNVTRFATRPVAVDSQGRLVLAGSVVVGTQRQVLVARFLRNGTPDVTFGSGGETRVDLGPDARAQTVIIAPGDEILSGVSRPEATARGVLKFLQTGELDTTWGVNGYASARTGDFVADGMLRRSNGDLWLAGHARPNDDVDLSATIFDSFGSVKTALGTTGTIYSPYPSDEFGSAITEVAGGVVLSGQAYRAGQFDFILVKLHDDGNADGSFGAAGYVLHSVTAGRDVVRDTLRLPGGRLLAVGSCEPRGVGSDSDIAMAVFSANGELDLSFANLGSFMNDRALGDDELSRAVMFDNRRFLTVGQRTLSGDSDLTLALFTVDGVPVASFGEGGFLDLDLGTPNDVGLDLLPQPDGSLLVIGMTSDGTNSDFAVVRVNLRAEE